MANSLKKSTTDEATKEIYDSTSEKKLKKVNFLKDCELGKRERQLMTT